MKMIGYKRSSQAQGEINVRNKEVIRFEVGFSLN